MNMKNEYVLTKDKTASDGELATYMLLADHPHFVEQVAIIRRRIGLPREGFVDGQRAYDWEHANNTNKRASWDAAAQLVSEFNIKNAFRSDARFFTNSYILSPKIVANLLPSPNGAERITRHKIGARLIKTNVDIESDRYNFKSNALYLEITDQTSTRDIDAALKKAQMSKKDMRPFAMPKPTAKARLTWKMRVEGATNQQVANEIYKRFGTRLTPQQVPLYAGRYEKALRVLRPLKK